MYDLRRLFDEPHERSLWRVLGLYVAGSWLVLEVVATFVEQGVGPSWAFRGALLLLLLGLPVVLLTAFLQRGIRGKHPAGTEAEESWGAGAAAAGAVVPAWANGNWANRLRDVFTWRHALVAGVSAFALLGLASVAYMAMRSMGIGPPGTLVAKGVLEDRDRILLVEFENRTADPVLADVVTEALRVDLAQSPVVRLAEPAFVAQALARMERADDEPLTRELALQLAQREGIKAVLAGEVGAAGTGYVLTGQWLDPSTGEILVSDRRLCLTCPLPGLAAAYQAAGRLDSTLAVLERHVSAPNPWRVFEDQAHLGSAYERLARLYEERGEPEKAARYYSLLVELWKDSDGELKARVRAAQARLDALAKGEGVDEESLGRFGPSSSGGGKRDQAQEGL